MKAKSSWRQDLDALGWLDIIDSSLISGQEEYLWRYCSPGHGYQFHRAYRGLLKELANEKPSSEELAARGRIRRIIFDFPGAMRDFSLAQASGQDCPWALAFEGELRGRAEPDEALRLLDAALVSIPGSAPILQWRGGILARMGRLRQALDDLDQAVALSPKLRSARLLRGMLRRESGDFQGACDDFTAFIEADPSCSGGYALRSMAKADLGDLSGAIEDAHQALEIHPDNVQAFAFLAGIPRPSNDIASFDQCLLRAFSIRESRPSLAWETIAKANPGRAWPLAYLGRFLCLSASSKTNGLPGLQEILVAESLSDAGWIRAWRGRCLAECGRPREALQALDEAIALDPHYTLSFVWRAEVWEHLGNDARALEDLAVCLVPGGRGLHYLRRARIGLRTGDAAGAVADIFWCMESESEISLAYCGACPPAVGKPLLPRPTFDQLAASSFSGLPALRAAWLGRLRLDAEDAEAACAVLSDIEVEGSAWSPWVHAWRAEALCRMGSFVRALAEADAALGTNGECAPARACRAAALRGLGWQAEGAQETEKAAQRCRDPGQVEAWVRGLAQTSGAEAPIAEAGWSVVVDGRVEAFAAAAALAEGSSLIPESGYLQRARERLPGKHPAVRLAAELWAAAERGRRPASLLRAVDARPLLLDIPRRRVEDLALALREFSADGFAAFFEEEAPRLDSMLAPMRARASKMDYRRALEDYLGPGVAPPHRFHMIASPLLSGTAGAAGCVQNEDTETEIFVVWGRAFPSRSLPGMPVDFIETIRAAWRMAVELMLSRDGAIMGWTEHGKSLIARAILLRMEARACGEGCARRLSRVAEAKGLFVEPLCRLLLSYEGDRERFGTIRDFYPWLARGLESMRVRSGSDIHFIS